MFFAYSSASKYSRSTQAVIITKAQQSFILLWKSLRSAGRAGELWAAAGFLFTFGCRRKRGNHPAQCWLLGASQRGQTSYVDLAANNHRGMRENTTVSQALLAGAIIKRAIKRSWKLLPIAGVTFMSHARL